MSHSGRPLTFVESVANELGIQNLNPKIVTELERSIKNEFSQIIQESLKFARHAYRKKLLTSDIQNAFNMRNLPPIFGPMINTKHQSFYDPNLNKPDHSNSKESSPSNKNKNKSNILIKKDPYITSNDLIKKPSLLRPPEINVVVQWLAINGKVLGTSNKNKNDQQNNLNSNSNKNKNKNKILIKPLVCHDISKEQQLFFEVLQNTLIKCDVTKLEIFIDILENSDAGLIRLVPRIIQFISSTVKENVTNKQETDLLYLTLCMRVCESLISSKYLSNYLENYLQSFMPTILTCCLKDRLCISPMDNHWNLRNKSAKIIKLILDKFGSKFPNVKNKILRTLIGYFKNYKLSFTTHYGCIIAMKYLGVYELENGFLPLIIDYIKIKLKNTLEQQNENDNNNNNDNITQNIRKQYEAKMVFSAILECLWICFEHQQKKPNFGIIDDNKDDTKSISKIYMELQEMFGEALLPFNEPPPGCGYFI